jgi:TadE-like protein
VDPGKNRRSDEKGVAIIELAMVLPVVLILIFSTFDFGLYFLAQHSVQFGTREGARLALVGRILNDANGNPLSREASIVKAIRDNAKVGVNPADLEISIYAVKPDYSDPDDWSKTQDAGNPGGYMRVRTRYYYHFVTPVLAALMPNGKLLVQAQATYRNELF